MGLKFKILNGMRIVKTEGLFNGSGEIIFHTEKDSFKLYHKQDAFEKVLVEDLCGDQDDLQDCVVISAEEVSGETPSDYRFKEEPESYTWTFYKIQTNKGCIEIRWLGMSSGFYSEKVDFSRIRKKTKLN